jgi:hypothetical protein
MSDSNHGGGADEPVIRLRDQALDWLPVDDEVVVLDGERDLYLGTNSSGSVLWEALAEGATRTQLVDLLISRFSIERDRAAGDVEAFLEQLANAQLLEEA